MAIADSQPIPAPDGAHIALLPTPGMGHLSPMVQFAKAIHHRHSISITLILPTDGPISAAQKALLSTLPPAVDCVLLPPPNFDDLPPDFKIDTRVSLAIGRSIASIRNAVKSLLEKKALAAFVVDPFVSDAYEVAIDFQIPLYIFFPSTAMVLSLFLQLPELDETVECEYADMPEKLRIPGCVPIHGRDLMHPLQDRQNDAYKWVLHHAKKCPMAQGILVNTFMELERGAIQALQQRTSPIVYPIGPLIQKDSSSTKSNSECLNWLDEQPSGSVLFISFGSGGVLSHAQIIELALGLEMSEQRFLWVIRCPNDKISYASFFNVHLNSDDPLAYLPEGFLERTQKQGMVIPLWGPQVEILAHNATGGFLSHCGWNSTLESVVNGVPIIAWPLYAEQRMNAVMLVEEVKVAVRPKAMEDGIVGREEMARVVKGLMEGEEGTEIRNRMKDLKDAAAQALEEGGTSSKEMAEVVGKWKKTAAVAASGVGNH